MTMYDSPRVSIILSTYKSEKYLVDQLRSIEKQSIWNDAELIVAANEPNDAEKEILEQYNTQWRDQVEIVVIPRETLYASWNRCIRLARSGLLAIANVDDIRAPESIEIQVSALEETQTINFCYGPFVIVRQFRAEDGDIVLPPEFDNVEFTRSMHLGPFFVWRKKVNGEIQYFDEQFHSGGDFDFAIRLAIHGRGVLVDDLLGYYLDTGSGLSTGSDLQPIERTVIELRYGIYDKIDYDFLLDALKYNVSSCNVKGEWHEVSQLIPEYDKFILNRKNMWFEAGIEAYAKKLGKRKIGKPVFGFLKRNIGLAISAIRSVRYSK